MGTPPEAQPQASPAPPKRRVRSESQLNQKRLADRLGHKERRKEHKQRIGKIEDDIADIKSTLQALTLHLRALPSASTAPPPSNLTPAAARRAVSLVQTGSPMTRLSGGPPSILPSAAAAGLGMFAPVGWPMVSSSPSSASTPSPQNHGFGAFPPSGSSSSSGNYASMWGNMSPPPDSTKILDCRCGLQHTDTFNCIDSCSITTLYHRHTVFPPSPGLAGPLPRNPAIPSMMLHNLDENPATYFITGLMRNFSHRSLEQLLGFYLIGYRYMRVSSHHA